MAVSPIGEEGVFRKIIPTLTIGRYHGIHSTVQSYRHSHIHTLRSKLFFPKETHVLLINAALINLLAPRTFNSCGPARFDETIHYKW